MGMSDNTNYKEKRDLTEEMGVVIGVIIAVSVSIFVFFAGLPHSESVLETESEFSLSEELLIRELTNNQSATTSATSTLSVEVDVATSS